MKPQKVDLVQGSEEWLSWRRCHLTATDTAKIMGLSKWGTAYDVYQDKMGLAPPKFVNAAMQRGKDLEPEARERLSKIWDCDLQPACYESGEYPFMGVSLDAITADGKRSGEIKCPMYTKNVPQVPEEIPIDYFIQCQKHMLVMTDLKEEALFYYFPQEGKPSESTLFQGLTCEFPIKRDDKFIKKMITAEKNFWFKHVLPQVPPPLTNKDFQERDNAFENALALKWSQMKAECDSMEKSLKVVETQLKELSEGFSVHYPTAKVKLTQISRRGTVNWKSVCEVWKINEKELEKFRKEKSSYVKFSFEI